MSPSSSRQPRSTKRKRNDDALPATRRRNDENALAHQPTRLQLFVRMTDDQTLAIHADPSDNVQSIYEKVESMSKIHLDDHKLGLIYKSKQLLGEQTLVQCGVENNATLLSADLRAWRLIDDVLSLISKLQDNATTNPPTSLLRNTSLKSMLQKYIRALQLDSSAAHLRLLHDSSASADLVMLYASPMRINKDLADESIRGFISTGRTQVPEPNRCSFARIVLQFCTLLRDKTGGAEDPLYRFCRRNLADMTRECSGLRCNTKSPLWYKEILPFVSELAGKLAHDISLSGPSAGDVKDLSDLLVPLRSQIEKTMALPIRLHVLREHAMSSRAHHSTQVPPSSCREEASALYDIFLDLTCKMGGCMKSIGDGKSINSGLDQYLLILRELHHISKLYYNGENLFGNVMKQRSSALNHLLKNHKRWSDGDRWILQHKEATSFEARRHLAMLMLPNPAHQWLHFHEMVIDRSKLLSDSFRHISRAQAASLRSGLFMARFMNEQAAGPGVVREWFALVCQAIFDPQRALFVACPADRRRFFPNHASEVDPLHLKYFNFSGRVIALALMHKIQVGIVLDRVFFKQLAGEEITLEDIRDADPCLHNSCKQILEMDPEAVDQDALGLTFVHEVEFLGARKVIELRPGGENIVVNSENRKEYIDVLIRHLFAVSIKQQITHFAQGFADLASSIQLQKSFFQCLDSQDLDMMLYGSDKPICVDDWRAHTEYQGFVQSDNLITWFWEVVESLSPEQKRALLFFWTSVKYLPVEGFKGLASKLQIYKCSRDFHSLPTSQTCFSQLSLPCYPSRAHLRICLRIITRDHVACSFGAT